MTRSPRRRTYPPLIVTVAWAFVLSACSATQATSTPATSTPDGSSRPSDAPTPSNVPDHPTQSDALILRLEESGGFVAPGFFVNDLPTFSLYGDGTALYARRILQPANPAGPPALGKAGLDAAQMSALLAYALGQGGLGEARADYSDNPSVADGSTSTFTIHAGGIDKTVAVYALGFESANTPDRAMRARLDQLATVLRDCGAQIAAGRATDAGLYDPASYKAVLAPAQGVPVAVRDWPWIDVSLADFKPSSANDPLGRRVAGISPAQARVFGASPEGGLFPIAVRGPDGGTYTIALRPLLPDESVEG